MIRANKNAAKTMEFSSFNKKKSVTDDELLNGVLKFESLFSNEKGFVFHCLVKNYKDQYANVLFTESHSDLDRIIRKISSSQEASEFFSMIEIDTVKVEIHNILKDSFIVPEGFACIEHGTFTLKQDATIESLINVSNKLEKHYLNSFDNSLSHFVGHVKDKKVSEIAIGKTYAKTKQICYGYYDNQYGQSLLELADLESLNLDFWYLIA